MIRVLLCISPEKSSGRVIALPLAESVAASAFPKCLSFYVKVFFYVMGKALTG